MVARPSPKRSNPPSDHSIATDVESPAEDASAPLDAKKTPPPPPTKAPQPPGKSRRRVRPPAVGRVSVTVDREPLASESKTRIATKSMRRGLPGMLGSLLAHLLIFIVLALLFIDSKVEEAVFLDGADPLGDVGALDELSVSTDIDIQHPVNDQGFDSLQPHVDPGTLVQQPTVDDETRSDSSHAATTQIMGRPLDRPSGLPVGGGLEGRTTAQREALANRRGATPESESAVEAGLAWLANHQRPNGSWWFDHHDGDCNGQCGQPGTSGCSTAATGLALLAFLGAGYTTEEGPYKQVVRDGIYYLLSRARITEVGANLQEGSMYGHGIATLALCEAYAMTGDQAIEPIAKKAILFICNAQHDGGGWRYVPGQPGDTTVFGWQFMALKSAQMAGLTVPTPTIHAARHYLNTVQTEEGAAYGYLAPGKDPTPTAIALLCRMYMGWSQDHEQLGKGVDYLFEIAPSDTDMYFNYYATQVMHHHSGQTWDPWNRTMRDYLVRTQSRRGHERGSWYFPDDHGDEGGRLYNTAMAIMILEVYYRYMPMYGEDVIGTNW